MGEEEEVDEEGGQLREAQVGASLELWNHTQETQILKKGANETDFKHKIPRTEVKKRKKKKGIHSEYVFVVTQSKRKLLYDVVADVLQMKTLW